MIDISTWPYRQSVSAFIFDKSNKLLICSLNVDVDYDWNVPGGGIEEGETPEDAIYREVKEEVNISREDLVFLKKSGIVNRYDFTSIHALERSTSRGRQHRGQERTQFIFRYIGDLNTVRPSDPEIKEVMWMDLEDLDKYLDFERINLNAKLVLSECADAIKIEVPNKTRTAVV